MEIVLFALAGLVLFGVMIISLVAVRRSRQGDDLDLEVAATGWLDVRLAQRPTAQESVRAAA
jgi:hypothetical protein